MNFENSSTDMGEYLQFRDFAKEHKALTYPELDHHCVRSLNLFAIREDFDFDALDELVSRILACIPAMKRIFASPIIRLRDSDAILPVESVRVINSKTVTHTAGHSELWDNVSGGMLKPRKLLTLQSEDDYTIYENLIFAETVDITLAVLSKNISIMRDMLYACRDLKFNLLDREDHPEYFLAIGKLHMAYVRDYDRYIGRAKACLSGLLYAQSVIKSRLGSQVYKKCSKKSSELKLKKTNIFRSHKDYARIYSLYKWYLMKDIRKGFEENKSFCPTDGDGYTVFCSMLSIFAIGHFNFSFANGQLIDPSGLSACASFKKWKLLIESKEVCGYKAISFSFYKDKAYRILLLPSLTDSSDEIISLNSDAEQADEVILAFPDAQSETGVCLSLYDLQSFRRIQQILQRGMIYSDESFDDCPFCGKELSLDDGQENICECNACRTQIIRNLCPKTGKPYFSTDIKGRRNTSSAQYQKVKYAPSDKLIEARDVQSLLHYRNITEIDAQGSARCPFCKEVH